FIIWAAKHSHVVRWISPVVVCYATGMLLANIPFVSMDESISKNASGIAVFIAIPLLLFSADFIKWLGYAKKTILSFLLCMVGVVISTIIASFVFSDDVGESWKISGMLIGVYTGGTPNMSAIGLSLNVKEDTFILLNAADMVLSSFYLIFLMTGAQRLLLKFLPAFKRPDPMRNEEDDETNSYSRLVFADKLKNIVLSFSLSVILLGTGIGLSYLIYGEISFIIIILSVTTLGIAASFAKRIRNLTGAYEAGDYLMLVFCIAIGTLANFGDLINAGPVLFSYVALTMSVAIILHLVLAAIFRIDADTVIITSTAGIFGAPFIAPIASVLKNRNVLLAGLTTSLVGYALGNYLGLAMAYILKP
ncbi:MAG: DUF819 family protein, partial [Bacteroidetes bacterium]|nr:DUF819 family protein [Bacteroidota bacterium]